MLSADAYVLWEQKRAAIDVEIAKWRAVGEDTAFPDVKQGRSVGDSPDAEPWKSVARGIAEAIPPEA